jgi:drug/metabolite transporter (DMT)-like permease
VAAGQRAHSDALGRQLAVACAFLFGANGVQSHWFRSTGGTTPTLIAMRYIFGALLFAAIAASLRTRLPSGRMALAATLSGFLHVGFTACLLYGFQVSSVALTVLLFYTYPLLVALGGAALYREPLTGRRLALVVLGVCGVALAVGTPGNVSLAGVLLGLGAGFGNAVLILSNQAMMRRGLAVEQIAGVGWLAPGACCALLWLTGALPLPPPSFEAWSAGTTYAVFGTVAPFWIFYTAVKRIGASLASFLATLEPFVAAVLAWALIDEPLAAGQIAGGAMIVASVMALSLERRRDELFVEQPAGQPVERVLGK